MVNDKERKGDELALQQNPDIPKSNKSKFRQMMRYETYKPSGVEWIGDIPEHWEVKRLKNVADIKFSSIDKHYYDDEESVKLCNYVDVYKNEFIDSSISFMDGSASESECEKLKLQKGDVLVTKDSETPQDIAIPALVAEELNNVVCGYHLALIRPHKKMSGGYLFRLFQTKPINAHFEVSANGITRYGLGVDAFGSLSIFSPPLPEQLSISAYLDSQTQKIDQLIANKKAQAERLKELRRIEINNAVTKGLNPHAPMKDSGIEWLGEIPGHWTIKRIKRIADILRGASPRPIDDEKYFDDSGEYSWVRISDVTASDMYLYQTKEKLSELGSSLSVKIKPNDLFVSIAGSVGKPIISKIKACIHDGFIWLKDSRVEVTYLFYLLNADGIYGGLGKLGTQLNLNTQIIGNVIIPIPPKAEQLQIAEHLKERTASIDKLIKNTGAQIEKLQELRKIKIYEAVTGKVKCHA